MPALIPARFSTFSLVSLLRSSTQSVSALLPHGISSLFSPTFSGFLFPDGSRLPFRIHNSLFLLPRLLFPSPLPTAAASAVAPGASVPSPPPAVPVRPPPAPTDSPPASRPRRVLLVPADVAHARLGHRHDRCVAFGSCSSAVSRRPDCEVCPVSSSTTAPVCQFPTRPTTAFGQLVHVDLKIFRTKSVSGHVATCGFINAHTGLPAVYHLKAKSEAFSVVNLWCADTAHIGPLLAFHTDGGGEFTGSDFEHLIASLCIRHELTAPNSGFQNSPIERLWRTAMAMTSTMLIHTNLPMSFWSFALSLAIFILAHVRSGLRHWCSTSPQPSPCLRLRHFRPC